jgi:hypothetical protein
LRGRAVVANFLTKANGDIDWTKVGASVLVAAALLAAAVAVGMWDAAWATEQALIKVEKPTYVPPTSTLPAIATGLFTLAGAWSSALVALVVTAKNT